MKKLSLIGRIRKRMRNEHGQSTTEYILILAIVVMLAGKVKGVLTKSVLGQVSTIDSDLQNFNSTNN